MSGGLVSVNLKGPNATLVATTYFINALKINPGDIILLKSVLLFDDIFENIEMIFSRALIPFNDFSIRIKNSLTLVISFIGRPNSV